MQSNGDLTMSPVETEVIGDVIREEEAVIIDHNGTVNGFTSRLSDIVVRHTVEVSARDKTCEPELVVELGLSHSSIELGFGSILRMVGDGLGVRPVDMVLRRANVRIATRDIDGNGAIGRRIVLEVASRVLNRVAIGINTKRLARAAGTIGRRNKTSENSDKTA